PPVASAFRFDGIVLRRAALSSPEAVHNEEERSMKLRSCGLFLSLAFAALPALADDTNPYKVSVSTLITTPLVIEGLTTDTSGNMYAPGRQTTAGQPCPVYKVNANQPTLVTVGQVPAPAS